MTVHCSVSVDNDPANVDVTFQAVPRVGESVAMSIDGDMQNLRVSRVVHVADAAETGNASVVIEVTRAIL